MIDAIVVGSGPSGVNAATALCDAGLEVVMVDFGNVDEQAEQAAPHEPFSELRRHDSQQHRYFLGDDFSGIPLGSVEEGTKIAPLRRYALRDVERVMPVLSDTFSAHESLARGGFGVTWGAGSLPFRDADFTGMPVGRADMEPHYHAVARRIGISGGNDDLAEVFGDCGALMPPLDVDSGAEQIMRRYERYRAQLRPKGFHLGRARVAILSEDLDDRSASRYHDMEYWADTDESVYRPQYTLRELRKRSNFSYEPRRQVQRFVEDESGVEVVTVGADGDGERRFRAGAVVLSAGTMSSARITLRSLDRYGERVPILTNPYRYVPSVNLNMAGVRPRDARSSLAQLSALHAPAGGYQTSTTSVFSYRSMLTSRLIGEAPLAHRESIRIMRTLIPMFAIVTVFHEDRPSADKWCALRPGEGGGPDRLEIGYRQSDEELGHNRASSRAMLGCFRRLGVWPIKAFSRDAGGSIHYAGTLPMTDEDRPLTVDADCRLRGTRAVYVADGSVFSPLPSLPLTFTIMANADRVGTRVAAALRR